MNCATCGTPSASGTRYCGTCGRSYASAQTQIVGIAPPGTRVATPPKHTPAQPEPQDPATSGGWIAISLLSLLLVPVLAFFATFPSRSLMSTRDGDTLGLDALIGLVAGILFLTVAILLFRHAAATPLKGQTPSATGYWATALGIGLLYALSLASMANAMSVETLLDGVPPSAAGIQGITAALSFAGFGTLIGLTIPRGDRRGRLTRGTAAAFLAFATAAILFSLWTLANAEPLRVAAEARGNLRTPGPGTLMLVAIALTLALLMRHKSREQNP